jgi:hypothetical protein
MLSTSIDERLANPYLVFMDGKRISRSVACAVLSMFLVACMVTTPLCAARCAAPVCDPAPSGQSADTCHHASQAPGDAPILAAAAKKACATGELLFTPPRLEPLSASTLTFVAPVSLDLLNVAARFLAPNLNAHPRSLSVFGSRLSVALRI